MTNFNLSISEEGKFTILCDYHDIISSKSIIVSNDTGTEYYLYEVIPPYPSCEEYSLGEEFEEGNLLAILKTWEEAKTTQTKRIWK